MKKPLLDQSVKILLFIILSVGLLYFGKPLLVPILLAALLAMLVLPLCIRLEKKITKTVAVSLSLLLLLVAVGAVVYVIFLQASNIADNASQIEKNISERVEQLRSFATNTLGLSPQKQKQIIEQQQEASASKLSGTITGLLASLGGFLTTFLIIAVYIFLFLLFRAHFRNFILRLVPSTEKSNTQIILQDIRKVSQKYLGGLALMIACLWVMYGIGFTIVGVKNAVFFAILCGLLEIVPFVGNLTGVALTLLMTLAQNGSTNMLLGIVIVYSIVQFSQSYFLEPLVVGQGISINPVFTIIGIIAGEWLWGIPGMILALPLLGILKIICDHVEALKPYGFLIGQEKEPKARRSKPAA